MAENIVQYKLERVKIEDKDILEDGIFIFQNK